MTSLWGQKCRPGSVLENFALIAAAAEPAQGWAGLDRLAVHYCLRSGGAFKDVRGRREAADHMRITDEPVLVRVMGTDQQAVARHPRACS